MRPRIKCYCRDGFGLYASLPFATLLMMISLPIFHRSKEHEFDGDFGFAAITAAPPPASHTRDGTGVDFAL